VGWTALALRVALLISGFSLYLVISTHVPDARGQHADEVHGRDACRENCSCAER
jgi:hypothetical protein